MAHRQTIYFSDNGIAKIREKAKKDRRSVSFALNDICENLAEPRKTNPLHKIFEAEAVFSYWVSVMNKNLITKLTTKRDRAITARLNEGYTVDQIKLAIDGCKNSPFHQGQNDNQKKYDDIELICRDGGRLESFWDQRVEQHGKTKLSDAERFAEQAERASLRQTNGECERSGSLLDEDGVVIPE